MSNVNPLWGAPRIHGELLKLDIEISQATVAKYMVRRRGVPLPTWRGFLRNQVGGIAAIDMFVVASASFRLLYVMIILAHDRRRIIHTAVTEHPTAAWLSRQVTEAFPWDAAPRYLLRDRDASYGQHFRRRVDAMGSQKSSWHRAPWQNAYAERVIGSIRRECLDHIVIFNERHLRRVLSSYLDYYQSTHTHLSLDKDCPDPRPVMPPRIGRVFAIPQVSGLHHRYERLAAGFVTAATNDCATADTPSFEGPRMAGLSISIRVLTVSLSDRRPIHFSLQFISNARPSSSRSSDGIVSSDNHLYSKARKARKRKNPRRR
jgi:putative transposase